MELKTKMIKMEAKMETNQLGMKEDLAELLRRGSTTSSPSVISTPLPGHPYRPIPMAYMPRTGQQFSFHMSTSLLQNVLQLIHLLITFYARRKRP